MANFTNFTRSVTAAVGALLISTACRRGRRRPRRFGR